MMNTIKQRLLFLIVAAALFTVVGWCQSHLGGITGRVTDPSGAAIPEAAVVLTSLDTGTALTGGSSSDGIYSVSGVAPGRYRINVTKAGFKAFTQEPIFISTETVIALDISLTVGMVTQTVSVTAQAAELQTTSAEIGTVMPEQAMLDLPISLGGVATTGASGRRQIESFTFLTPGVTGTQWYKYVNGSPGMAQDVLIDGFSMGQMDAPGFIAESSPPYEAVEEFKMQNMLYPAEYGQGLGLENYTLKSGTSQYHGDAFDFLRNGDVDARGFFSATRPALQQNEYGFTFGGPLNIPKVYDGKRKTFFFVAYSGFKLRGGLPPAGLITLPTAQERAGDFSDYPYPIFDPVCDRGTASEHRCSNTETRQQFSYNGVLNVIPPSLLSAVALRATALLPANALPGYINNYVDHSFQPTNENVVSIKIDQTITEKQHLSGALWEVRGNSQINGPVTGPLNPDLRNTPTVAGHFRINHTYTISPTLLNHAGFGYSSTTPTWSHWSTDPRQGNQVLQIPGIPTDAPGYPELEFSGGAAGYQHLGNSDANGIDPTLFQRWSGGDDLTWVKGRHQFKVGGEYSMKKFETGDKRLAAGIFYFNSDSTSQPNDPADFGIWGNSYASFLLGEVSSAERSILPPVHYFTGQAYDVYAEDSIKITPKLTASLGLRYELPIYPTERNGNMSYLSLTAPNAAAGGLPGALVFQGNGAGRTGTFNLFGHYYRDFAPRTGLAYQINNKTVMRMGYGIFRMQHADGRLNVASFWDNGFGLFPSFTSLDQGITPAFNLDSGFPATNVTIPDLNPTLLNNAAVAYINPSANKPSMTQSWTVDFQRELPSNILLDAAYVGSNSTGLWSGMESLDQLNPSWLSLGNELNANISCIGLGTCPLAAAAGVHLPYPGFNSTVAQAVRPFPQYTAIYDMYQPTGHSTYNSLQVRLQKRYSNGLSFLGAYTLSKNIGAVGGDIFGDIYGAGGFYSLNTYDQKLEKALLGQDQTHVFVFSWSYALPFGRGKKFLSNTNAVVNQLLGGWQFNSVESYSSGTPISIYGGPNLFIDNGYGNRPNWNPALGNGRSSVSMSNFDPAVDRYLSITPWSDPAPFTFGNGPRMQPNLRNPAYYDEDFSVFKNIFLHSENRYLQFRAEFFNIFNRVDFGGPSTDIDAPGSFGIIGGQANTPRVIQFALKLIF
jgi:hypothetical protein